MDTVKNIRKQLAEKLSRREFVGNTIEIIGATFLADSESIFGTVNHEWNSREMKWYLSGSTNINDIEEPIPVIWKQVSSKTGEVNSHYGHLLFSEKNGSQYKNVLEKLKSDPNSRQGQIIMQRPSIHTEWNRDGMHDFICTAYIMMLIRDNKLVTHYVLRSQDAIFGYRGDLHFCKETQRMMANDLGIECGPIIWTASSLHVYSRHYYLIDNYLKSNGREITTSKEKYITNYPKSEFLPK